MVFLSPPPLPPEEQSECVESVTKLAEFGIVTVPLREREREMRRERRGERERERGERETEEREREERRERGRERENERGGEKERVSVCTELCYREDSEDDRHFLEKRKTLAKMILRPFPSASLWRFYCAEQKTNKKLNQRN